LNIDKELATAINVNDRREGKIVATEKKMNSPGKTGRIVLRNRNNRLHRLHGGGK